MTFSLVARDADGDALGAVVCSSSPAVAARCLHVRDGAGAVCSQNVTDPRLGPHLLDALAKGVPADAAIVAVVAAAPPGTADWRQLLVVDAAGRSAIHSGAHTLGTVGEHVGEGVVAAGNLLASADVPRAMVEAFAHSDGPLEVRLLAALRGGLAAGGEAGPVRSAGLATVAGAGWPVSDLRVDWADDPVGDLAALLDVWLPQRDAYVQRALDPAASPGYGVAGDHR